jgi:hypothetical protein
VQPIAAISLMRNASILACFVLNDFEPTEEDIHK